MCGHPFWRTLPAANLPHPLPQFRRFTWVVTGAHQQIEADLVGFCFMLARIGQHSTLRRNAEGLHDGALLGGVHVTQADTYGDLAELNDPLLADTLGTMMGERMADLVPHNDRQLCRGLQCPRC